MLRGIRKASILVISWIFLPAFTIACEAEVKSQKLSLDPMNIQTLDDLAPARPLDDWLTFGLNLNGWYRDTEFFVPDHHVSGFDWDGRLELWLPPYRRSMSWGPYLRLGGIVSNKPEAFENALLAAPGLGLQFYPLSLDVFKQD